MPGIIVAATGNNDGEFFVSADIICDSDPSTPPPSDTTRMTRSLQTLPFLLSHLLFFLFLFLFISTYSPQDLFPSSVRWRLYSGTSLVWRRQEPFFITQSIYFFNAPVRLLFSAYRSRGDLSLSSNDCFTQDTIAGCATLIIATCVWMMNFDSDWLLNRTYCGVIILSSLVTLAAKVRRNRWLKKNCDISMSWIDIIFRKHLILCQVMGPLALYRFILTFVKSQEL